MEDRRGKNVVDGGGGKSESDEQGTSSRTTLAELFSQPHDQEDPADKKEDDKEGENQEARITTVAELFSREADEEEPADKKEDDSSSSSRKQERVSITEKGSSSSRQHDHDSNPLLRAHLEPQLKLLRDCKDEVEDLEKDIEALQQCYELGGDENSLIQRISSSDFKELSANLDAKLQALKNSIDKKKELEEEIKELTEQVEFGCNLIVQCYAGINQQEAIPAEGEAKATDNPNIGILFAITPTYSGHVIEFYYKEANSDIVLHSVSTDCPQKWNKLAMKLPSLSTGKNFFEFVGSCNGLICYRTQTYWFSDVTCVYNPFTTESIAVFNETSASFKCIGFGYCISTKKYKLVRICEIDFGERRFQVNSVGEGRKWRDKPKIPYAFLKPGIAANGSLHWLIDTGSGIEIIAFSLADETFGSLQSPVQPLHSTSYICSTLEGDLCLCIPYTEQSEYMMDIWVFSTSLEATSPSSFIWNKIFSRKVNLESECRLLSSTDSRILLWDWLARVLSCYDFKATISKELWSTEGYKYVHATPCINTHF